MLILRAMYQSPLARQPWRVNARLEGLRGLGAASARLLGGGSLRRHTPIHIRLQPLKWRPRASGLEVGSYRLPALLRAPPNPPSGFPGGMPLAARVFAEGWEQRAYVNGSVRRLGGAAVGAAFSRQPRDWYIALTISESG